MNSASPMTNGWGKRILCFTLLLGLVAGCTSLPASRREETRRALRSIPKVPRGHLRADQALVAAFFAANGITLTPGQTEELIPPAAPQGRIDRKAIRQIATKYNRLLMVVNANPDFLWDELGNNLPLLILLPPDLRYNPATIPVIPIAWDAEKHTGPGILPVAGCANWLPDGASGGSVQAG